MRVLSFEGVTVRYEAEGPAILEGIDLEVAPGERVALLGLNGSGKTTLLKATVGLLSHSGCIHVCGERLERPALAGIRTKVGFLFNLPEDQLLFPEVLDDVAFGLRRKGVPLAEARSRARSALASLGAEALAECEIHHLSHGQKQRVALAGALATEPELLLLDEPSAALDPPGRVRLARLLEGLNATMVIATHDLEFARACCTRALLIQGGRLFTCPRIDPDAFLSGEP
jgi:cobalt/nickel transport system ATP-binding protein